jgi:hypothetical protein
MTQPIEIITHHQRFLIIVTTALSPDFAYIRTPVSSHKSSETSRSLSNKQYGDTSNQQEHLLQHSDHSYQALYSSDSHQPKSLGRRNQDIRTSSSRTRKSTRGILQHPRGTGQNRQSSSQEGLEEKETKTQYSLK